MIAVSNKTGVATDELSDGLYQIISAVGDSEDAIKQIRDRRYDEALREDGRCDLLAYGIAFNRKRCRVICERI